MHVFGQHIKNEHVSCFPFATVTSIIFPSLSPIINTKRLSTSSSIIQLNIKKQSHHLLWGRLGVSNQKVLIQATVKSTRVPDPTITFDLVPRLPKSGSNDGMGTCHVFSLSSEEDLYGPTVRRTVQISYRVAWKVETLKRGYKLLFTRRGILVIPTDHAKSC